MTRFYQGTKTLTEGKIIKSCNTYVIQVIYPRMLELIKKSAILPTQFPLELKIAVEMLFCSNMTKSPFLNSFH
jgi:hypothetical protein